jgi:hypothetical protein
MIKARRPMMTERHANTACDTLKRSRDVSDDRADNELTLYLL